MAEEIDALEKIAFGPLRHFLQERNSSAVGGFIESNTTPIGSSSATKPIW